VFLKPNGDIGQSLTYGQLRQRARALAGKLVENNLRGNRAILAFPPGLDFVVALFACFYSGVIAAPVPFFSGKRVVERIDAICHDVGPSIVLTVSAPQEEPQFRQSAIANYKRFCCDDIDTSEPEGDSLPTIAPSSLALLQYTSGSTSAPKGVMLTHANLMANSAMIKEMFGHNPGSRGVGWLPLFHDMGLVGHVLQPVYFGGISVLMSPLAFLQKPVRWLNAISRWKATTSGGPNHAFELCLKLIRDEEIRDLDLSSWQVAYCGSEKIRANVLRDFAKRFAVAGFREQSFLPCFGLAEATLLVAGTRKRRTLETGRPTCSARESAGVASCGAPAVDTSVVIVDPMTNEEVGDGDIGEVWVQGPQVAQGYWGIAANANSDQFRARLSDGSGPYLRTGDLAFIRDDQLFLIGRIKDTIIVNGVTHAAEDIEACMRSHQFFAGCVNAAFAVDADGREQAVLIQEVRGRPDSAILNEAISAGVAAISRQLGIRLFDLLLVREGSLTRTSSGKVRRTDAREKYHAQQFERLTIASLPYRGGTFDNDGGKDDR
jgi:acyl-CoA synthetase (AMP-forming)/AMP-acid ligase II